MPDVLLEANSMSNKSQEESNTQVCEQKDKGVGKKDGQAEKAKAEVLHV